MEPYVAALMGLNKRTRQLFVVAIVGIHPARGLGAYYRGLWQWVDKSPICCYWVEDRNNPARRSDEANIVRGED